MTAATFTLTGDIDSDVDRSVYWVLSTDVTNPTDDITYPRAAQSRTSGGVFSLTLPADAGVNLPHSSGGPQFYFTIQIGTGNGILKSWIVPAQASGSTHDITEFAAAVPVSPSTTDTTIVDNIVAGRIAAGGSATQGAGDARWVTQADGDDRWVGFDNVAIFGHNVMAFGAVGDGTTNDTAAFTAAIAAAGTGGRVFVPPHAYKLNALGTLPTWQTMVGIVQNQGPGPTATTELLFTGLTGATTAMTLGSNGGLRDLNVRGPGYSVGTVTGVAGATMDLKNVSVLEFATGVAPTNGYYCNFDHVEFLRNGTGLRLVGCYNVALSNQCRFECTNGATYGTAINAGTVRPLTITGCSIENYSVGIQVGTLSEVSVFGTYWESAYSGAVGIKADSIATVTINAYGCLVYLDSHNQWIKLDGSTDVVLNAHGQHFSCFNASPTNPTAYYLSPSQDVDLSGDSWKEVVKAGAIYATTATGTILSARIRVTWPVGAPGSFGTSANPVLTDGRVRVVAQSSQTLASNGAVTFDAAVENQVVTLQANATSSTINNAVGGGAFGGQELSITFVQDATGARTYAWPTNCRFTGGAAPSGTAASTRNTVRFRYDSSAGRWYELSRATAVPV